MNVSEKNIISFGNVICSFKKIHNQISVGVWFGSGTKLPGRFARKARGGHVPNTLIEIFIKPFCLVLAMLSLDTYIRKTIRILAHMRKLSAFVPASIAANSAFTIVEAPR